MVNFGGMDMNRRQFTRGSLAAAAWGLPPATVMALGMDEAAAGVRAALERGAASAVSLLGRSDGFLGNPKVRIPLPGMLEDAAKLLSRLGQKQRVEELVTAMNRAAEQAVPEARTLLMDAVRALSVEDAIDVVRGGSTSVTDFFARKTRAPLTTRSSCPSSPGPPRRCSWPTATTPLRRGRPVSAWSRATTPTCSNTSPARRWTACT
jgi:hypothetical protein